MSDFEVRRGKIRYWASRFTSPRGDVYKFYSSHKWPWYHGHIQTGDRDEALKAFREWLPFKLRV